MFTIGLNGERCAYVWPTFSCYKRGYFLLHNENFGTNVLAEVGPHPSGMSKM